MSILQNLGRFTTGSLRLMLRGGPRYWSWVAFLVVLIVVGFVAYLDQLEEGLIRTSMRDQVSWGLYIGNFTFLVGVAAAAVLLVIPAYVYHWKPIKEVVILGELLAISALVMCGLFVFVDIGHPERAWHLGKETATLIGHSIAQRSRQRSKPGLQRSRRTQFQLWIWCAIAWRRSRSPMKTTPGARTEISSR